jgi:hypothetical protein
MCFLLASSCHGLVGASVRLLWESTHLGLISMADWWAWSLLIARVELAIGGDESFAILGTPRTIRGAEWSGRRFASSVVEIAEYQASIFSSFLFATLFEQECQCPSLSLASWSP